MVLSLGLKTGTSDQFCVRIFRRRGARVRRSAARVCLPEVLALNMILHPQAIVLTAFEVVMAAAAFEDFRRLVIPNLLPIILVALWPIYFAASPSIYGALAAIGCAAAVFL